MYNGKKSIDISRRTAFVERYLSDVTLLLPYTVEEGERPEDIALSYYGSIDHFWLVLMANKMNNYYEDWVKDGVEFDTHLMQKYKEQSGKLGYDIINWTMNEKLLENILYYVDSSGEVVSKDTILIKHVPSEYWGLMSTVAQQKYIIDTFLTNTGDHKPVRIYEYEYKSNENKRNIVLVNKDYIDVAVSQFEKSFK